MDVLTGNIGNVSLKAIRLAIEDNARLQALLRATVSLGSEEYAEFERHIETRQRRSPVGLSSGYVVDAVSAFFDYLTNLVEAIVRRVVRFASATRYKSGPENCGIEECFVTFVKWAVYENLAP
jgi:hypothetical protein